MKQKRKLKTILNSPCAIIKSDDKQLYVGLLYSCTKLKGILIDQKPYDFNLLISDSGLKDFCGVGNLKENISLLNNDFIYIENNNAYHVKDNKKELINFPDILLLDNPSYYEYDDSIVNYSTYTIKLLKEKSKKVLDMINH